ncbi:MAG: hypothetical protein ABFS18_14795 [Thermodesulfobacteriota bacterium]
MDPKEQAKQLVKEAEELTAKDLRAALAKFREAILLDSDYPELEDEIFLREDAISKLDGVLEFIVKLLREGKEYQACQMLKDLPDNYVIQDKSGLVKNLSENIAKVERLILEAKSLPPTGRKNALVLLDKATKLLPDYPGLQEHIEAFKNVSKKMESFILAIVEALKTEDTAQARKVLGEFKAAYPNDTNLSKCEVAIRNKEREIDQKRYVRMGFIKRLVGVLVVSAVFVAYGAYEIKMVTEAGKEWKQVSQLLADKKFSETQAGCRAIVARLGRVRLLFQTKKQELLTQVDEILNLESVIKGAQGQILFDGDYIPKKNLAEAKRISEISQAADGLAKTGKFKRAIKKYEEALVETAKVEKELAAKIGEGINLSIRHCYESIINDLLSKANALKLRKSFDVALDKVEEAAREAERGGLTGKDPVAVEIASFRGKIFRGKLKDLILSGNKIFKSGNYAVAIKAYKQSLAYAREVGLADKKLIRRIDELINKSKVNGLLAAGENYYQASQWPEAAKLYKSGLKLAGEKGISDLLSIKNARYNLPRAEKMGVTAVLARKNSQGRQQLKANEWGKAREVFSSGVSYGNNSRYAEDRDVVANLKKLKAGLAEAEERIFIDGRKEYLQTRYARIIRRVFGLSGQAAMLNPEIVLLTGDKQTLKFSISAMSYAKKGGQGKYSRYEIVYALDRNNGSWGVVNKSSDSKVAADKAYN